MLALHGALGAWMGAWPIGCTPDPDPTETSHDSSPLVDSSTDPTLQPLVVTGVTPVAAAPGWLSANFVASGPIEAALDGEVLQSVIADPEAPYGMWRLPPVAPGRATVSFTDAARRVQTVEIEIARPWFEDVVVETGLDQSHVVDGWAPNCAESLTSVGVADVDLDGDFDLLQGNLMSASTLYINDGASGGGLPHFVKATGLLGEWDLVTAVQFADWDNDGDPDLFLGRRGHNKLLRNEFVPTGVATFVDVSAGSGLVMDDQRTTSGGFGDFDGDGDLDLYEVNHAWCYPSVRVDDHHNEDHLYRNLGDGTFEEVTALLPNAGGQTSARFGFTALWLDYDRNGTQDLWVVNDFVAGGGRSILFRNDGPGSPDLQFADATTDSGVGLQPDALGKTVNGMGGAVGDLNHDGWPDLIHSNIGPNYLLESTGSGTWQNTSVLRETERTVLPWTENSVTWGVHLFDVDNDGDLDPLYVGGALKGDAPMPHALFENVGPGPMVEVSWSAGVAAPSKGASTALVDLDGDGWLDWVVANWGERMEVWHNVLGEQLDHHWLIIDLEGDGVAVNRDAFGAIVEIERLDGTIETCWRNPKPSMAATGDPGCHFGLGTDEGVTALTVTWPDGVVEHPSVPGIDRRVRVTRAQ